MRLCGINSRFQLLSPCMRQVTHALLTRPPLSHQSIRRNQGASFDLHVLGTPPAFILSQDQTLMFEFWPDEIFSSSSVLCSGLAWLILFTYCFKVHLPIIMKDVFFENSSGISPIFIWNFRGCFTVQLSRFFLVFQGFAVLFVFYLLPRQQDLLYHAVLCLSTTFFIFLFFIFLSSCSQQ